MCGYMFIFTDPMELAGAEMIAADQAVQLAPFCHYGVPERAVMDHENRLLSLYNAAEVLP